MNQGDIPGSFDGFGQLPLMSSTHTRHPSGDDLSLVRNKPSQGSGILIVNPSNLAVTELANFPAAHKRHK